MILIPKSRRKESKGEKSFIKGNFATRNKKKKNFLSILLGNHPSTAQSQELYSACAYAHLHCTAPALHSRYLEPPALPSQGALADREGMRGSCSLDGATTTSTSCSAAALGGSEQPDGVKVTLAAASSPCQVSLPPSHLGLLTPPSKCFRSFLCLKSLQNPLKGQKRHSRKKLFQSYVNDVKNQLAYSDSRAF